MAAPSHEQAHSAVAQSSCVVVVIARVVVVTGGLVVVGARVVVGTVVGSAVVSPSLVVVVVVEATVMYSHISITASQHHCHTSPYQHSSCRLLLVTRTHH